jgi:hypothetical protein
MLVPTTTSGRVQNQRAVYSPASFKAPVGSISVKEMQGHYVQAVRQSAKEGVRILNNLISTWGHRDDITIRALPSHIAGGNLTVDIEIDDDSGIFFWLDEGTSERWAIMSKNFIPKTERRNLIPYQGVGRATIRGRWAMTKLGLSARPGIEEREFTLATADAVEIYLEYKVDLAVKQHVKQIAKQMAKAFLAHRPR